MIRKSLFTAMFCALIGMVYATSVQSIRIEDFRDVASRMVLDLSASADFVVEPESNGFYIGIEGFDGKLPSGVPASRFITSIQLAPGGIQVTTTPGLRFERMKLSSKAVVDMFIKAQTKAERMAVAAFYSKIGKLASADNAYHQLAIDYPGHNDVLYHWGLLLLKRESSRAGEKLALISANSQYYADAQRLLQGGTPVEVPDKAVNLPLPARPEPMQTPHEPQSLPLTESVSPDTSYIKGIAQTDIMLTRISLWDTVVELALRYFVITISIFIAILVILCILISHKRPKAAAATPLESPLPGDAMLKMVARLAADGWTAREIARELKISAKEAESLIRNSHFVTSDSTDENG